MSKIDIHKRAMIEAMIKSLGIVTTASKACGVSRQSHYDWYNNDADYRAEIDKINEVALDYVESRLYQRMQEGSDAAIIFFLKCRGRSRGYGVRVDMNVNNDQPLPPLVFTLINPEALPLTEAEDLRALNDDTQ